MQYPRYRLKYERGEPRQPWPAGFGLCSLGQSLPWTASVAAALNASAEFAPTAELELHSDTYAPGNARAYDELILWRRILSDADVMQLFAETQTCAFFLSFWRLVLRQWALYCTALPTVAGTRHARALAALKCQRRAMRPTRSHARVAHRC